MMTEEEADKAHEVWEFLYELLRTKVFQTMDKHKLTDEQRDYITRKLHDELRYWI